MAGLESSDRFWNTWVTSCWFGVGELPSSVEKMYRDADLVILGTFADLYIGEYWNMDEESPPMPLTYAAIDIVEVFKGEPVSRRAGQVEVQMSADVGVVDRLRRQLPDHQHLFFLTYEDPDTRGIHNQNQEIVGYVYFAQNEVATVLRDIGGEVRIIRPDWIREAYGRNQFPLPLEGTSFDALIEQVRRLAGRSNSNTAAGGAESDPTRYQPLFAC